MKLSFFYKYYFLLTFISVLFFITGCGKKETVSKVPITVNSEEAKQEFIKGRDLFEKLKFNESLPHFENAVALDTSFALAYYYIAQASPTTKQFSENMKKAVSLTDKVSAGERNMIMALQANADGNSKIEEDNLVNLVKEFPKDERSQNLLGTFYFSQQMYPKAVDHFKEATVIAPEYSPSYNMLGYCYKNMGNYGEAETAFKKYTELVPNEPNPYDSYAELLMKEGKYDQSIQQYNKAISLDSNFVSSYVGLSCNYNFLGQYSAARKELQTLYEKVKNNSEKNAALYATIVSYADEDNLNMALDEAKKQFNLNENIKDTIAAIYDLIDQGDILYEDGRYNDASEKYNDALNALNDSKLSYDIKRNTRNYILYNTVRILIAKNDLKSAEEKSAIFSESAKDISNTPQIWLSHELQGLIALKQKDFIKAENEFKMGNQQNPYTFYYLGLAYKGQKKNDLARENFKEAANFNAVNNLNQSFIRKKALRMAAEMK